MTVQVNPFKGRESGLSKLSSLVGIASAVNSLGGSGSPEQKPAEANATDASAAAGAVGSSQGGRAGDSAAGAFQPEGPPDLRGQQAPAAQSAPPAPVQPGSRSIITSAGAANADPGFEGSNAFVGPPEPVGQQAALQRRSQLLQQDHAEVARGAQEELAQLDPQTRARLAPVIEEVLRRSGGLA